jgi:tetratricopeptide (TPR) repeat protein
LTQVSDSDVLKAENLEPLRRELLRTAKDFYERFVQQDPGNRRLQMELGKAHERLGLITSLVESRPKALEHYQKMRVIFERLHEADPSDPLCKRELATGYFREAECLRAGAEPPKSEAAYLKARALQEALVRAYPHEPDYQVDLGRTLRCLGNYYVFLPNDHVRGEQSLLAALAIFDGLGRALLANPAVQFEHGMAFVNLAKLYGHSERPGEQRIAAKRACDLFDPLARAHPGNPDYRHRLEDALTELGDAYRCLSLFEEAQSTWQKALGLCEDLARSHPANGYYRHTVADVAYCLASLAYHERRQPAEARRLLQKALGIEEELTARFPTVSEHAFYLNNVIRDFCDWFGDIGPLEAAHDRLMKKIAECEQEAGPDPEPGNRELREILKVRHLWIERLLSLYRKIGDGRVRASSPGDWCPILPPNEPMLLARARKYTEAANAAADWAASDKGNGNLLYPAAQSCAAIVTLARSDRSLAATPKKDFAEFWSKRAVEWLQKAQALKYFSSPSTRWLLADDRCLDPLRERADFQALLTAAGLPTKEPKFLSFPAVFEYGYFRETKSQSLKYLSSPLNRWLLFDDRELHPLRDRADFRALLAAGQK